MERKIEPLFNVKGHSRIYIGTAVDLLPSLLPAGARVVAITDANIDRRHHELLTRYEYHLVGTGETVKTLSTVEELYRRFIASGVDRSTFVLGIGGGIVTDIAGFVASTYMRGLRFGFVSTTLLGQVDASVGGKNGVNVDGYKNMAGTFNQPEFVVCDASLLATLPIREFRSGLAEAVKAGIIADSELFALLEQTSVEELRQDEKLLERVVAAAIGVKAGIVERDERESGERRKLNLGHTLGHAIEKCSPKMNHGEAVAVGVALMARMAVRAKEMEPAACERIEALLHRLGFQLTPPVELRKLLNAISKDKKAEGGMLHAVLPTGIGSCTVLNLKTEELASLLADQATI